MLFRPSFLPIWFDSLPILPGSAAGAATLKYFHMSIYLVNASSAHIESESSAHIANESSAHRETASSAHKERSSAHIDAGNQPFRGVGWDDNVHVPMHTQAQQPHHLSSCWEETGTALS